MGMQELEVIGKKQRKIQKLNWKHQQILDLLVENPDMKQKDVAKTTGMSQSWISTVMGTDLFRAEYARRRGLLVAAQNEIITDRLRDNVAKGVARMGRIVDNDESSDATAVNATKTMFAALGFGAKNSTTNITHNNNTQVNADKAQISVSGVSADMLKSARERRDNG